MYAADIPDIKKLDYIQFHGIVETHEQVFVKAQNEKQKSGYKSVKVVRLKLGSGQVRSIAKRRSKVIPHHFSEQLFDQGKPSYVMVSTARVDTGPSMGMVTAVIDGSDVVGKQLKIDE